MPTIESKSPVKSALLAIHSFARRRQAEDLYDDEDGKSRKSARIKALLASLTDSDEDQDSESE